MRLFASAFVLYGQLLFAAPPAVSKVDPPSWWAGHSINPVRLLVRGTGLQRPRVTAASPGFHAGNLRVNDSGSYLFFDLSVPRAAKPGSVKLSVSTAEGEAAIPFEISAPLARNGRFQGFSSDDLIYLVMPDRFADGDPSNNDPRISKGLYDRKKTRYYHGGDLQGILDRLPYLHDLGVTAVWVTPIYDNVNHLNTREKYEGQGIADYHGYGAIDLYAVDEHLGTLLKFRELVDKAHALGIKIIQDQVENHTGPYHPWVNDSPTPTWFNGTLAEHLANTWQTWTLMDPHSPPPVRKATLEGWFLDILPDLNQKDPEVARYLIQNTLWWIGVSGMDGIRQDTLPYVPRSFWREWMAAIKREYPNLRVVGEMFDGDPSLVAFFQGGAARFDGIDSGVDSLFDFPLYYPIRHAFAMGKPIREIPTLLAHDRLYPNPDMLVTFLGLHDVKRFMNEDGADTAGLKLAFTLLMTARGIPMIYYGDEIALRGSDDPDNRRDFPGGFPGDRHDAFTAGGRTPEERAVFDHVRTVARLRAANDCMRRGPVTNLLIADQAYAFRRTGLACSAIVVMNNDDKTARISFPLGDGAPADATFPDAMGGVSARVTSGTLNADLPARSAAIYLTRK
jgi:glycosidase